MPEGDTVRTIALALQQQLVGQRVTRLVVRRATAQRMVGQQVVAVESHGKHLCIVFSSGVRVRSHLGMHGSWHCYQLTERWQRPNRQAGIVLQTEQAVYVCFNPREVTVERAGGFASKDIERRLGPDLAGAVVAFEEILVRARRLPAGQTPLVDLLLDQRVAAGIGNVYKSELLFLQGLSPIAQIHEIADDRILGLYRLANRLIRDNLGGGMRRTRNATHQRDRIWVYGRFDAPCFACTTKIKSKRIGRGRRSTYWCPSCQACDIDIDAVSQ